MVDEEIGRVLGAMDELGLTDNTVVVFTSDHGDMDSEHRLVFKGPFMYEQMVRVPLIIRAPGVSPRVVDDFAVLTDILPTLCDIADADAGTPDGYSLRPYLEGKAPPAPRKFVVSEYYSKQEWVNPIRMLRTKDFKYTRYIAHGEELYDLKSDPHELTNLAGHPEFDAKKAELRGLLDEWMRANGDDKFDTYWPTNRDNSRWTPEEKA
jgi:arylsulfatase A-like enzyme